jgi:hemerythrin
MTLFTWKESYSVHVEELDSHHKALFGIVNRLYENCLDAGTLGRLDPIINELAAYTVFHFSAEERYMTDTGFRELPGHVLMHQAFSRRIEQLRQNSSRNDLELTKELIVFLGSWLLHHVLEEDKLYASPQ